MRHTVFLYRLAVFCLGLVLPVTSSVAQDRAADDVDGAVAFIEKLAEDTKTVWSDATLTETERQQGFRDLFNTATDVNYLARAMIGRHYRTASTAQRQAYLAAMEDFIIGEFDTRMTQIGFRDLIVTGTVPAPGKRGHLFVRTKVESDTGDPLLADWRVRKKNGVFQIVNLEVEGINLVITNREVFSARISEVGMDGLITELREKYPSTQNAD